MIARKVDALLILACIVSAFDVFLHLNLIGFQMSASLSVLGDYFRANHRRSVASTIQLDSTAKYENMGGRRWHNDAVV